jgi:CRISPR/Cas system-associated endonuclease Cas1
LADDLEEQVGAVLVDRQVADLIQDQELGPEVFSEFAFEGAPFLGGAQVVDDIDGVGKENRVAL